MVSYITGEAVDWMKDKSDDQVKDQCMTVLKKIFPKEVIALVVVDERLVVGYIGFNGFLRQYFGLYQAVF